MDETDLQTTFWLLVAAALLTWPVLGHWPRVGGTYLEAGHTVQLGHVGPLVWGRCLLPEGEERYFGVALLGRLVLRRYDHGARLLAGRGFPRAQLPALNGVCTGLFRLRLDGAGDLTGAFYGRRFTTENNRMVPKDTLDAVSRHWRRAAAPPAGAAPM